MVTKKSIMLIIIGVILLLVGFINLCGTCSGIDVINPLCQIGFAACATGAFLIQTVLKLIGLTLVIIGAILLIKN